MKAALLELIETARAGGWSTWRAAGLLGLDLDRVRRWRERAAADRLDDARPGGGAVHAILPTERASICELFEAWSGIDRSHRKLAHRGSRLGMVHVSESTMWRVLAAESLVLPGKPAREPRPRAPWPDWVIWKPNIIWCYDFTHFSLARRVAIAIIELRRKAAMTVLRSTLVCFRGRWRPG